MVLADSSELSGCEDPQALQHCDVFSDVQECYRAVIPASSCPLLHKGASLTRPATAAKSLQSCPTLCDPIDSSPPGSPIPGILQARTLEWVAISFSSA